MYANVAYMWRKEDVIKQLKAAQGDSSLRAYASSIGCSAAYLSDIYNNRREPGQKILDELGLEKKVVTTVRYVTKRRWK